MKPFKVVTICGSMRFYNDMLHLAAVLTSHQTIVLMPFVVIHPGEQTSEQKAMLDEMHRVKIDMADEICVVTDATGYIGESTRGEIAYAEAQDKSVRWFDQ